MSTSPCTTNPLPLQSSASYNAANNRMTSMTNGMTVTPVYDAAGNLIYDGNNEYWYDSENRICASQVTGGGMAYQYAYDAEGARYAVGTLTTAPVGYSVSGSTYTSPTCAPPTGSNFSLANQYLVDLGGNQVTELNTQPPDLNANGIGWAHTSVWIGGRNIATYDWYGPSLHFNLEDPLGTKRVVANILGQPDEMCSSLPFGNDVGNPWNVNCQMETNSLDTFSDPSEHHFTQKERDWQSGNDYFLARYYSSAMGRFMSPDWSAKETPVPYAVFTDPQSLNLYAYVGNSPLGRADADGHLQREADGSIAFDGSKEVDKDFSNGDKPNAMQRGTVYANDGHKIEAWNNVGPNQNYTADCHGVTFGQGEYWINNDQVGSILKHDGYTKFKGGDKAQVGDVAIFKSGGEIVHSMTVTGVGKDGKPTELSGLGGTQPKSSSASPGAAASAFSKSALGGAKVKVVYYHSPYQDKAQRAEKVKSYEK
jgi:RHS repeat-associated protein